MVLYNIKLLRSLTEMIRDIALGLEGQRTQRTNTRLESSRKSVCPAHRDETADKIADQV